MALPFRTLLSFPLMLLTTTACTHQVIVPSQPANIHRTDNAYMDLAPGWKVRIVVPLLKSGGLRPSDLSPVSTDNGVVTVSSSDLIGYRVFHYSVLDKGKGLVRLQFVSSDRTENGRTEVEARPPMLPFALPLQTDYIRLVYLVRASGADHNMAVIASKRIDALNIFTNQFEKDPNVCGIGNEVSCVWVPAGIAVRPEKNDHSN